MALAPQSSVGFFQTLGALAGSRQRENQLSRTFKACFDASPQFRSRLLALLGRTCGVRLKVGDEWECLAELGHDAGGRFDIVLRSPAQPTFRLESKVESVLTLTQLRRYRPPKRSDVHLVAVTKYRPDVPRRKLRREGIHAIRWQDIHGELTTVPVAGRVDQFIASSFAELLEGEDMAYRSQLTAQNLTRATRLLAVSASTKTNTEWISARDGFASLDSLAHLITDVTFDVRDEFPKLADWNRWGPQYRRWESTPLLGGGVWRGRAGRASYRYMGWGFTVGKGSLRLVVWIESGKEVELQEKSFRVSQLMGRGGGLDKDRVWQTVRRQLQNWKFATRR